MITTVALEPSGIERIDFRAKYFLSPRGVDYCVGHRVPLKDLRGADGLKSVGFEWSRCRAASLERLVIGGLLESIELDRPEFLSVRPSLIAMIRSALHGAVVGRFRGELRRLLPPAAGGAVADVSDVLRECARRAAPRDPEADGSALRLGARLLGEADPGTLGLALSSAEGLGAVADSVLAHASRMELAEQLALLLAEFVQVAEKSHMRNLADHDRYARSHPDELQDLLADSSFRARLIEAGERRGDVMALRVSFFEGATGAFETSGASCDPAWSGGIGISVRTKGIIGGTALPAPGGKRWKSQRSTDLATLLKSASRDDGLADLSLAYYTSFEEACAGVGMGFASSVLLDGMKDETTATMRIGV